MAIDERSRHELHRRLADLLGPDEAATLMAHLPPVGWADVATRRDLDQLEGRMNVRLEALRDGLLAMFRQELMARQRHIVSVLLATVLVSNVTLAGLAFAAARLF